MLRLLSLIPGFPLVMERLRRRRLRRRRNPWGPYHLAALLLSFAAARATTVAPPSFPDLVGEAEIIARGRVTDVSARWVEDSGRRVIKTYVTFAVERTLKGTAAGSLTLELLGGEVGTESLRVGGMPQFKVGDREIVFVRGNGAQFCPLVRVMHGRYRVRADGAQRHFVARDDDTPLASTDDVQLPAETPAAAKAARHARAALSVEAFEGAIATEAARHAR